MIAWLNSASASEMNSSSYSCRDSVGPSSRNSSARNSLLRRGHIEAGMRTRRQSSPPSIERRYVRPGVIEEWLQDMCGKR